MELNFTCLGVCVEFFSNWPGSCMQEVAAAGSNLRRVVLWGDVASVHPLGAVCIKHRFHIDCAPVEIDSKRVFFLFMHSAPRDSLYILGGKNVIHFVAAVSIICPAAVGGGIKESSVAAWLRKRVRLRTLDYREMDVWRL